MKLHHTAPAGAIVLLFVSSVNGAMLKCPPDSAKVGNACIDLYEASVWQLDPANTKLVKLVQSGKVTLADLTGGGATQLGSAGPGYHSCAVAGDYGTNFPPTGNWIPVPGSSPPSPGVYAVSVPGVLPSACITWFQANQACLLSAKRLITNREWQGAAAGTPDPGTDNGTTDCNLSFTTPVNAGSRSNCKSSWGVFDMVGNVDEWVADWADRNNHGCTDWINGDLSCFGGDGNVTDADRIPGALIRGGSASTGAGVFSVHSDFTPRGSNGDIGFRCAR